MDTIRLTGISARAAHGVLSDEHVKAQPFSVDVTMGVDTRLAGRTDDLSATLNYVHIAHLVTEILQGGHVDLIEVLAEKIAARVLEFPVYWVDVTIHKPEAPIDVDFDDVSVTIHRENAVMRRGCSAVIALGSNLPLGVLTPSDIVTQALCEIANHPRISLTGRGRLYRSAAVTHGDDQPDYVNTVITVDTRLSPVALMDELLEVEAQFGRVRDGGTWGPRTLDLDIINVSTLAGPVLFNAPTLTLPHPRAAERSFVVRPWLDCDPMAELPGWGHIRDLPAADAVDLEEIPWPRYNLKTT